MKRGFLMSRRYRNYATIVYPESAPDNWLDILKGQHVPAFISPLHDEDIGADGNLKKPHYHVLFMFTSVKTMQQAKDLFLQFGGVGVEAVNSLRSYARYLCHLDDTDKAQYSVAFVQSVGDVDYTSLICTVPDRYKTFDEIIDYCKNNNIYSWSVLLEYAKDNNSDWFKVLCDNGIVIFNYLRSRAWTSTNSDL